jgi:hypothetical protein
MAWWDRTPTVMPAEVRDWVVARLLERMPMSDIKRDMRGFGWHQEADGDDNGNRDRVYRAVIRVRDELVEEGRLPPSGERTQSSPYVDRSWNLTPGDRVARSAVHDRFGGSRRGGTASSNLTPNICVFLDRTLAPQLGYFDGWVDGLFCYTGQGQGTDQRFVTGNAAVLHHREDGRAIRIFRGARGVVTYLGRFELDALPFVWKTAGAVGMSPRQVIVFRMRPVGDVVREPDADLQLPEVFTAASPVITRLPLEEQHVTEVEIWPSGRSRTAVRREQGLVLSYAEYLAASGSVVSRFSIVPPSDLAPIICDLHDETRNNLVEAKASGSRAEIRMAIGQLYDYRRFAPPAAALGVLLPSRPRPDLEALLLEAGISAIWRNGSEFADNAGGRFG